MYDEYEEIQQFLDEEADSYVPFEAFLEGHGFTFEEALNGADNYRSKFFSFLGKNGITSNNINLICVELAEKLYKLAEAEKICSDKEKALQYAELCLLQYMEELNRQLLIDALPM